MTWNYRIMKRDLDGVTVYEIHEVYYKDNGEVEMWTEEPVSFDGFRSSSPEKLIEQVKNILEDCTEHSILDYDV